MNFLYLHRPDESLKTYRELLTYTRVSSQIAWYIADRAEQRYTQLCGQVHQ